MERINKKNKSKILIVIVIFLILLVAFLYFFNSNIEQPLFFSYRLEYNTVGILGGSRDDSEVRYKLITNYLDYDTISEKLLEKGIYATKYDESFFKEFDLLLVENLTFNQVLHDIKISKISFLNKTLNINIDEYSSGVVGGGEAVVFFVELSKEKMNNISEIEVNTSQKQSFEDTIWSETSVDKPIIYLYPQQTTEIIVKLGYPERITTSYPMYNGEWRVIAKSNGDLIYKETGRNLYSLYYESKNFVDFKVEKDGFVVKGKDTVKFLEEKLSLLGLSERESEEFIIYWLPKLEKNKYNYIRFATSEEINTNMPLSIYPTPDTVIRVLMTYKKLEEPIIVEEQKLDSFERYGFVAVEWGGTELN